MKSIIDIEKMLGFENREGFTGLRSVSDGKVFYQKFSAGTYPGCKIHGAMLCVAKSEAGKIWRCRELGCDQGCFEEI